MAEKTTKDAQTTPSNFREKGVADGILDLLLTPAQIEANEKVKVTSLERKNPK